VQQQQLLLLKPLLLFPSHCQQQQQQTCVLCRGRCHLTYAHLCRRQLLLPLLLCRCKH
jgi:hypothetical protein